jgi:hypothetical protein
MGPGAVFTTIVFLCNLRNGTVSKSVMLNLAMEKHSRLLGKFVSYKENEILKNGHSKQEGYIKLRHGEILKLIGLICKLQRK